MAKQLESRDRFRVGTNSFWLIDHRGDALLRRASHPHRADELAGCSSAQRLGDAREQALLLHLLLELAGARLKSVLQSFQLHGLCLHGDEAPTGSARQALAPRMRLRQRRRSAGPVRPSRLERGRRRRRRWRRWYVVLGRELRQCNGDDHWELGQRWEELGDRGAVVEVAEAWQGSLAFSLKKQGIHM